MAPITAQEEFSRHSGLKRENIEYLREWLTKQPHLPGAAITDEQLILFLHSCQHSLEGCKQAIESYYTIRTHAPELFGNRDPERPELKEALDITELVVMPTRDPRGNIIMVARLTEENASRFNFDDTLNAWFMLQDTVLRELGAVPGFVFVFDMKGCAIGHVTRIKLSTVKKYFMYIQDAFPGVVINNHIVNVNTATETFLNMCRQFMRKELLSKDAFPGKMRAIHMINSNAMTEKILALGRPFMRRELLEKLQVHTSMETLYEFLPKDVLPKEYGGTQDSLTEYYKTSLESLARHRDWFREIDEATKVDESKRPGKAKSAADIFGVEGSFKKLDID